MKPLALASLSLILLFIVTFSYNASRPLRSSVLVLLSLCPFVLNHCLIPGGFAWFEVKQKKPIPGPCGLPVLGSLTDFGSLAHQTLAAKASSLGATRLMALSFGSVRMVISSHPDTAKEILCGPAFVDRPVKPSARLLMFERAIGFAPCGDHWRHLRRIAATHMFSPRSMSALEPVWQRVADDMLETIHEEMRSHQVVNLRNVLRKGSLRMMIESVFGGSLGADVQEKLGLMVSEGYELITTFNLEDYFPSLWFLDLHGVKRKCHKLAGEVQKLLGRIVADRKNAGDSQSDDFLTALISLSEKDRLSDSDMVAVLWEMMFRGADTVANLLEWAMARVSAHQEVQTKLREEIHTSVGNRHVGISDVPRGLPYLQAVVKEVLRLHPPGPLLSWARLAVEDVHVDKRLVPAGTTAMVNMWAITHDPKVWADPWGFRPERFLEEPVSVMGSDMRLAPFGSGRRVCPGKGMGLAAVHLWLARLVRGFRWDLAEPLDMSEILKLSLEMKKPLRCRAMRCA